MKFAPEVRDPRTQREFRRRQGAAALAADGDQLRAPGDAGRAGHHLRADARALRDALDGISLDRVREVLYDGTYEDLFFYIERLIDRPAARTSPAACTPRAAATTST
jgi:hypothetical protein